MVTLAFLAVVVDGAPASGVKASLGWFAGLPVAVPEASSLALLIVGLAAVGVVSRRRQARLAASAGAVPTPPAGEPGQQAPR